MGMTKAERLDRQRKQLIEMKKFEQALYSKGLKYVAGVDEAGRGPLAGPVVAAAVILPTDFNVLGVDDSKKISPKKRDMFFDIIREKAVAYGIGMIEHSEIDQINILEATKKAMIKALADMNEMMEEKGLSGVEHILFDAVEIKDVKTPKTVIVKGDSISVSIAAASIIAKVTRDRLMLAYHENYPYYSFDSNKGYGTKAHYDGIREHGVCPIHRMTFLKNFIQKM